MEIRASDANKIYNLYIENSLAAKELIRKGNYNPIMLIDYYFNEFLKDDISCIGLAEVKYEVEFVLLLIDILYNIYGANPYCMKVYTKSEYQSHRYNYNSMIKRIAYYLELYGAKKYGIVKKLKSLLSIELDT